jgi:predicted nucleic acid-binding protein
MNVFVDTSALLAVLDAGDANHKVAKKIWKELLSRESVLVCSNYVLVEALAIAQHRFGLEAVKILNDSIMPVLTVEWVDEAIHEAGMLGLITSMRRKLSLVDCISFVIMRRLGIESAFAFDPHFKEQGFHCIS